MRTANSKECRARYCHNHTHNLGGLCNSCLRERVVPAEQPGASLERERQKRQPGARFGGETLVYKGEE